MNAHPTNGPNYFITTSRIGFRRWQRDDLELAKGLWGDHEVTKRFDSRGSWSEADVKARLQQEISLFQAHGVQYWPIFLIENGTHLGCCGLRPHEPDKGIYEIGFHIRSCHWGRGFATEAARAVIRYAFETLAAAGLFAGHHPENEASRHLMGKLGFRYTHDEFYPPTGRYHPSYILTAEMHGHMKG